MGNLLNNITIVDYGTSNLNSIKRALKKIGADVQITNDAKNIQNAGRLILPGVGSFGNGMKKLNDLDITNSLNIFIKKGNPFLGICLGMQMLLSSSEEDDKENGLNYIAGNVIKIPTKEEKNLNRKIPHIGWSNLEISEKLTDKKEKIFYDLCENDFFYFVHSYMCITKDFNNTIATCDYNNYNVTAAIQYNNIIGLQFHPEISGISGLKILSNFLKF